MKKTLVITLLLLCGGLVTQAEKTRPENSCKKIAVNAFTRLKVDANIDVILIEEARPGMVSIEGDKTLLDDIRVTVVNGELIVSSAKAKHYSNRVSIGIPVKQLSRLEINANANVSTLNELDSKSLEVRVNSDCRFNIKTNGKIEFTSPDDIDVNYQVRRS
jgi:hypothetical protein